MIGLLNLVFVFVFGLQLTVAFDLKENYESCLHTMGSDDVSPSDDYFLCLNTQSIKDHNSPADSCRAEYAQPKLCLEALVNNGNFSNCVLPENENTLRTQLKILSTILDKECTDNLTSLSLEEFNQCSRNFTAALYNCSQNTSLQIQFDELMTFAGFSFNSTYCSLLSDYNTCEEETIASCTPAARALFEIRRSAKWAAIDCDSILNQNSAFDNGIPNYLLTISSILINAYYC